MLTTWEYVSYLAIFIVFFILIVIGVEYLVRKNDEENPWKRRYDPDGSFTLVTEMEDLQEEESSNSPTQETNTNINQETMERMTDCSGPNAQETESRVANLPTRSLLIEVLRRLGGRISFDNEDGTGGIEYEYQGGSFLFDANDAYLYINAWYPFFHMIPLEDIDQIAAMRKVINHLNLNASCTLLYTIDSERGMVNLHCKKHMLFIPSISHINDYLAATLAFFFDTKRDFLLEFERERANH